METKVTVNHDIKVESAVKIAKIVQESKCKCSITTFKTADAGSILMLLSLGIKNGDVVTIKCDDEKCIEKICKILQSERD